MATKDYSNVQEHMIADELGWAVVSGSGAAACFPGDVISDEWLGECKTHTSAGKRIFFAFDVWEKICEEASVKRRYPVLFVDDGTQKADHTWCLFDQSRLMFQEFASYPITTGIRVNISFDGDKMAREYKKHQSNHVDKLVVFTAIWNSKRVCIVPLSTFSEIIKE